MLCVWTHGRCFLGMVEGLSTCGAWVCGPYRKGCNWCSRLRQEGSRQGRGHKLSRRRCPTPRSPAPRKTPWKAWSKRETRLGGGDTHIRGVICAGNGKDEFIRWATMGGEVAATSGKFRHVVHNAAMHIVVSQDGDGASLILVTKTERAQKAGLRGHLPSKALCGPLLRLSL